MPFHSRAAGVVCAPFQISITKTELRSTVIGTLMHLCPHEETFRAKMCSLTDKMESNSIAWCAPSVVSAAQRAPLVQEQKTYIICFAFRSAVIRSRFVSASNQGFFSRKKNPKATFFKCLGYYAVGNVANTNSRNETLRLAGISKSYLKIYEALLDDTSATQYVRLYLLNNTKCGSLKFASYSLQHYTSLPQRAAESCLPSITQVLLQKA